MNEENRQKMIAAMRIINEICIESICEDCPFYNNCGYYGNNHSPAQWEIPEEEKEK